VGGEEGKREHGLQPNAHSRQSTRSSRHETPSYSSCFVAIFNEAHWPLFLQDPYRVGELCEAILAPAALPVHVAMPAAELTLLDRAIMAGRGQDVFNGWASLVQATCGSATAEHLARNKSTKQGSDAPLQQQAPNAGTTTTTTTSVSDSTTTTTTTTGGAATTTKTTTTKTTTTTAAAAAAAHPPRLADLLAGRLTESQTALAVSSITQSHDSSTQQESVPTPMQAMASTACAYLSLWLLSHCAQLLPRVAQDDETAVVLAFVLFLRATLSRLAGRSQAWAKENLRPREAPSGSTTHLGLAKSAENEESAIPSDAAITSSTEAMRLPHQPDTTEIINTQTPSTASVSRVPSVPSEAADATLSSHPASRPARPSSTATSSAVSSARGQPSRHASSSSCSTGFGLSHSALLSPDACHAAPRTPQSMRKLSVVASDGALNHTTGNSHVDLALLFGVLGDLCAQSECQDQAAAQSHYRRAASLISSATNSARASASLSLSSSTQSLPVSASDLAVNGSHLSPARISFRTSSPATPRSLAARVGLIDTGSSQCDLMHPQPSSLTDESPSAPHQAQDASAQGSLRASVVAATDESALAAPAEPSVQDAIACSLAFDANMSMVYERLALAFVQINDQPSAIDVLTQLIEVHLSHPQPTSNGDLRRLSLRLGDLHASQQDFARAADCYQRSLSLSAGTSSSRAAIDGHCKLGRMQERLGQYSEALQTYQQALTLARGLLDESEAAHAQADIYEHMSGALGGQGLYDEAARYHSAALALRFGIGDAGATMP
jgi:hypothetical protein